MKQVNPIVIKIGETRLDPKAIAEALKVLGVSQEYPDRFIASRGTDGQALIELAGRICYESFEVGLNPNVTKIRESPEEYFLNIIKKGDGSIYEHSVCNFLIAGISRVASHELVRHRVGTAVSQESFRYVRPKEIGFWLPDELSPEQRQSMIRAVEGLEEAYRDLEGDVPWHRLPMDSKKRLTSALRRILPQGMTTNLVWSANHRTLRWVIEMRTDPSAEVEIRMIFDQVAQICRRDYPHLYQDFVHTDLPDGTKSWRASLRSKI